MSLPTPSWRKVIDLFRVAGSSASTPRRAARIAGDRQLGMIAIDGAAKRERENPLRITPPAQFLLIIWPALEEVGAFYRVAGAPKPAPLSPPAIAPQNESTAKAESLRAPRNPRYGPPTVG